MRRQGWSWAWVSPWLRAGGRVYLGVHHPGDVLGSIALTVAVELIWLAGAGPVASSTLDTTGRHWDGQVTDNRQSELTEVGGKTGSPVSTTTSVAMTPSVRPMSWLASRSRTKAWHRVIPWQVITTPTPTTASLSRLDSGARSRLCSCWRWS